MSFDIIVIRLVRCLYPTTTDPQKPPS